MNSILIKNGTIVTVDERDSIIEGDLLIRNGRIESIGQFNSTDADEIIDATNCAVLPGFIQTHIHLCQTLFRGAADDLSLIDWLRQRVWKMEAAHDEKSLRASARLSVAELIKGGTTCALTMETVNHTEEVFRVIEETGFRATVGKCMMDKGAEVPKGLQEETENSIRESLALLEKWHGRADGRIRYCFAPRFAISCTKELLERVAALSREHGVMVHTHASENKTEIEIVETETGLRNIPYLDSVGLAAPHVLLAHCVHLDDDEMQILSRTETKVSHCPSSNMKLGSGIARIKDMLEQNIHVSLGADGAPCNNRLDMFTEMRSAALLQKVVRGSEVLPARRVLRMATIDGAKALALENEIGSLETGKKADVILVDLNRPHTSPRPADVISSLVYSAQSSDVRATIVDGNILMREKELVINETEIIKEANHESKSLMERAGILN